jgi:phosphatidylinositol alpha-1,6-mannosyltransferase
MKVCFITNRLVLTDGSGRSSVSIIEELKKQGIIVKVLLSQNAPASDLKEVEQYKILKSLRNYRAKWFYLVSDFLKAKKYIADCDLIHCEIEPFAPLTYLLACFSGKPYFLMVHGHFALKPLKVWYLSGIFKQAYAKAAKIFCNSAYTQKRFLKEVKTNNTEVIGRGVDWGKFRDFDQGSIEKSDQKIILSVGIIKRRKGYHISLPAIAKVVEQYPNLKYIIVGLNSNDDYFLELKQIIKNHNLADKVEFKTDITETELVQLYYQADIFLLTPINVKDRFEGLGMVYLEANAAGKPVIGTYDCGAEDAIKDGYNGFLVPQDDIDVTAQVILKLLNDQALALKLGENGKALIQDLTWEKVVKKIISNYELVTRKN